MTDFDGTGRIIPLLLALALASCASQVPVNIREAPPGNPPLEQVRGNVADHRSQQVRWGGEILETENRENATWLTVLSHPLAGNGKPELTDSSQGRFLARIPGFLDPKVYKTERNVTVRGSVAGSETREVGDYAYSYPVVDATDWYLWPVEVIYPPGYYASPWWYDPFFYDPWFYDPWYRYPRYYPPPQKKDKTK
jgi:outer membrane lipoprotein